MKFRVGRRFPRPARARVLPKQHLLRRTGREAVAVAMPAGAAVAVAVAAEARVGKVADSAPRKMTAAASKRAS